MFFGKRTGLTQPGPDAGASKRTGDTRHEQRFTRMRRFALVRCSFKRNLFVDCRGRLPLLPVTAVNHDRKTNGVSKRFCANHRLDVSRRFCSLTVRHFVINIFVSKRTCDYALSFFTRAYKKTYTINIRAFNFVYNRTICMRPFYFCLRMFFRIIEKKKKKYNSFTN